MLEEDEEILGELIEASHEEPIPGLLALANTWHALDLLLGGPKDTCLGDAILARSGLEMDVGGGLERAKVLPAPRVRVVAKALAGLPPDLVKQRYPLLHGVEVHGHFGQERSEPDDALYLREKVAQTHAAEVRQLEATLASVVALYQAAAEAKHSMLSVLG